MLPFCQEQCTVAYPVSFDGIGVHSGKQVKMTVNPAPPDHGIIFQCQFADGSTVKVKPANVLSLGYCTMLQEKDVCVKTTEHFLAACMALGIDNLKISITEDELPILDGSSLPFALKLFDARKMQGVAKSYYLLRRKANVEQGQSYCEVRPSTKLKMHFSISYEHPWFRDKARTSKSVNITENTFLNQIASARTFGFMRDLPKLQSMGLAKGSSLENTVAFDDNSYINQEGLRFEQECINHKILDLLGDISVFGYPILGEFRAYCSGHKLNASLLKKLVDEDLLVIARANEIPQQVNEINAIYKEPIQTKIR